MWLVVVFVLLCLFPSEACVPVLNGDVNKLLVGLDEIIRNDASLISAQYESPTLQKKVRDGTMTEAWSKTLRRTTRISSIMIYIS